MAVGAVVSRGAMGSRGLGAAREGRGEGKVGGEPCRLNRPGGDSVDRGTLRRREGK